MGRYTVLYRIFNDNWLLSMCLVWLNVFVDYVEAGLFFGAITGLYSGSNSELNEKQNTTGPVPISINLPK